MSRVLHGMPIESLPEPGEIDPGDQIVAYSKDGGNAYRADVEDITTEGIDLLDKIYPVGSIYMSVNGISPATFIGGKWTQIEDCFLLAAGNSHSQGETGGSETVTLTSSQIPSHTHSLPSHTHSLPSHTHSIPSLSGTAASAGGHAHAIYYEANAAAGSAIRTAETGGSGTSSTGIMTTAGAHTHSVTTNSSTTGSASGTSGSTSGTSGSTGNGNSHNNMPPYLTVYMWQRVA